MSGSVDPLQQQSGRLEESALLKQRISDHEQGAESSNKPCCRRQLNTGDICRLQQTYRERVSEFKCAGAVALGAILFICAKLMKICASRTQKACFFAEAPPNLSNLIGIFAFRKQIFGQCRVAVHILIWIWLFFSLLQQCETWQTINQMKLRLSFCHRWLVASSDDDESRIFNLG